MAFREPDPMAQCRPGGSCPVCNAPPPVCPMCGDVQVESDGELCEGCAAPRCKRCGDVCEPDRTHCELCRGFEGEPL